MNSVKPDRPDHQSNKKEGAGERAALLCCTLFFLFQCVVFLSGFSEPPPSPRQLKIHSADTLELVVVGEEVEPASSGQSTPEASHRFSPFFFEPIAINFCDKALLMSVKGIGPSLADAIIRTREQVGAFKKADDLLLVHGIGPTRMNSFSKYFDYSGDGKRN